MEPFLFWNRLGGVLLASHSALIRRSCGEEEEALVGDASASPSSEALLDVVVKGLAGSVRWAAKGSSTMGEDEASSSSSSSLGLRSGDRVSRVGGDIWEEEACLIWFMFA